MKQEFIKWRPQAAKRRLLAIADEILTDSAYPMTVRQLYYQFVSKNIIPNSDESYIQLKDTIADGRKAGYIDWDKIEDRSRETHIPYVSSEPDEFLRSIAKNYHHDLWTNQCKRVEVIVEKQALEGIVERACAPWRTPYLASKGFASITVAKETAARIDECYEDNDQVTTILYCGDLDPSGYTMIETWRKALKLYCRYPDAFEVVSIGLTLDQVYELELPPQPTKKSDSRAESFTKNVSEHSYELDALPSDYFTALIQRNIIQHIDMQEWDEQVKVERDTVAKMLGLIDGMK